MPCEHKYHRNQCCTRAEQLEKEVAALKEGGFKVWLKAHEIRTQPSPMMWPADDMGREVAL